MRLLVDTVQEMSFSVSFIDSIQIFMGYVSLSNSMLLNLFSSIWCNHVWSLFIQSCFVCHATWPPCAVSTSIKTGWPRWLATAEVQATYIYSGLLVILAFRHQGVKNKRSTKNFYSKHFCNLMVLSYWLVHFCLRFYHGELVAAS